MVTIKDIAELAEVSLGTASNVLNKKGNVSSEKIRLVEQAARVLGYNTNLQAKRLRGENNRHVAVILPYLEADVYHIFYSSISRLLCESGYEISLHIYDNLADNEMRCYQAALSYRPQAVVMVSCLNRPDEHYISDVQTIFIDLLPTSTKANFCFCTFDYGKIAGDMISYLLSSGAKTAAFVGDTEHTAFDRSFSQEIQSALRHTNISLKIYSCDHKLLHSKAFEVLDEKEEFDVIITSNRLGAARIQEVQSLTEKSNATVISFACSQVTQSHYFRLYELDYRCMARRIAADITSGSHKTHEVLPPDGIRYQFPDLQRHSTSEELKLITLFNPSSSAIQNLLPQFTRLTGIRVKIIALPHQELYQALLAAAPENFDLIRMDMVWRNSFEQTLCLDLQPFTSRISQIRSRFADTIRLAYRQDDAQTRVLPFDPSLQMLFYRKDLFRDATINRLFYEKTRRVLQVPGDFESFNEVAAFFTRSQNPHSPTEYGTLQTYGSAAVAADDFLPRLYSLGGGIFDKNGMFALDTPEMRRALDSYISTKLYANPDIQYWWGASLEGFTAGMAAMAIVFNGYAAPIINSQKSQVVGKVGAAMVPGNKPLLGGGCIGISKGSQKVNACLTFLDWLYSGEVAEQIALLGGLSPCREVFKNEEVDTLLPWMYHSDSHFTAAQRGHSSVHYKNFDDYRFELILGMAVRDIVLGIGDVKNVLERLQDTCEREFR